MCKNADIDIPALFTYGAQKSTYTIKAPTNAVWHKALPGTSELKTFTFHTVLGPPRKKNLVQIFSTVGISMFLNYLVTLLLKIMYLATLPVRAQVIHLSYLLYYLCTSMLHTGNGVGLGKNVVVHTDKRPFSLFKPARMNYYWNCRIVHTWNIILLSLHFM